MNAIGVKLIPIVACPTRVQAGKKYLVTVDFRLEESQDWPYHEEEHLVHCVVDGAPWFRCQILDNPAVVLHRYGGSYGPATFVLAVDARSRTLELVDESPRLHITLKSADGITLDSFTPPPITIVPAGTDDNPTIVVPIPPRRPTIEVAASEPVSSSSQPNDLEEEDDDSGVFVQLNIRITGSNKANHPNFAQYCEELGREIGRRGHNLVISSTKEADGYALAGFRSTPANGQVIFVNWKDRTPPAIVQSNVNVSYRSSETPDVQGTLDASDAVIAIGGAKHTAQSCELALERRMPVVPLLDFGGDAALFYERALAVLREFAREFEQASTKIATIMSGTPNPRSIIACIEQWQRISQASLARRQSQAICRWLDRARQLSATGFLVEGSYLVTDSNLIPDATLASELEIHHDDFFVALELQRFFWSSPRLGVTIVAVRLEGRQNKTVPPYLLPLPRDIQLAPREPVRVSYFNFQLLPPGYQSAFGRLLDSSHEYWYHTAKVEEQAAGAPIFNRHGQLIGVHTSSYGTRSLHGYGRVVSIQVLLEQMERDGKTLPPINRPSDGSQHTPRVLFSGSLRHPNSLDEFDSFAHFARECGSMLGDAGYELIVGSLTNETAEYHAVLGAQTSARRANIVSIQPQSEIENDLPANQSVRLEMITVRGERHLARRQMVDRADIVVTIGGGRGTGEIIKMARSAKKRWIPIGTFAGVSQETFDSAIDPLKASGITSATIEALERTLDSSVLIKAIDQVLDQPAPTRKTRRKK